MTDHEMEANMKVQHGNNEAIRDLTDDEVSRVAGGFLGPLKKALKKTADGVQWATRTTTDVLNTIAGSGRDTRGTGSGYGGPANINSRVTRLK